MNFELTKFSSDEFGLNLFQLHRINWEMKNILDQEFLKFSIFNGMNFSETLT